MSDTPDEDDDGYGPRLNVGEDPYQARRAAEMEAERTRQMAELERMSGAAEPDARTSARARALARARARRERGERGAGGPGRE